MLRFTLTLLALIGPLLAALPAEAVLPQKILFVSAEQLGVLQTGGLAHAVTGLAQGSNAIGIHADILMPFYLKMGAKHPVATNETYDVQMDWRDGRLQKTSRFRVVKDASGAVPTIFLRHEDHFHEQNFFDNRAPGDKYAPKDMIGESFAAFSKAAADWILAQDYDLVVLNEWHMGLVALHLAVAAREGRKVPRVQFITHNMAYQGGDSNGFPMDIARHIGLSPDEAHSIEAYGKINFMKAGLVYSNSASTVSPTYARETMVKGSAQGAGLDGLLSSLAHQNRWTGILNGITSEEWDPSIAHSHGMEHTFNAHDLQGKKRGKAEMQKDFGLPVNDKPIFALTSRLAQQKGFEYFAGVIEEMIVRGDSQWVIVGDGEDQYVEEMQALQKKFPDRLHFVPFSTPLEERVTRYADFFMNASWFEPCGLNQFFALMNGTVPIVSRVGGLNDSVHDGVNGLSFDIVRGANGEIYDVKATQGKVIEAIERALQLYKSPPAMQTMRVRGMKEDNSWRRRLVETYLPLFEYVMDRASAHKAFDPRDYKKVEAKPSADVPRPETRASARARTCEALFK